MCHKALKVVTKLRRQNTQIKIHNNDRICIKTSYTPSIKNKVLLVNLAPTLSTMNLLSGSYHCISRISDGIAAQRYMS